MAAEMTFKMEITDTDLWHYILCLKDRKEKGNNNTSMNDFLYREINRLEEIHDRWGKFNALENIGVEVVGVMMK